MPRIRPVDIASATGKTAELLNSVRSKFGRVPNLLATFAHAPGVLEAYLGFSAGLTSGTLSPRMPEMIALVVGERNECDYCLAAHTAAGRMLKLSEEEIRDARLGISTDSSAQAVLDFATAVVDNRGRVTDEQLARVRDAGYDDGAIVEIVGHVALNLLTNYFNHVAETAVDFPRAEQLARSA